MSAAQKIISDPVPLARWVVHHKITERNGFTYEQMKKYRQRGVWAEGIHWRKNPVGTIVYNPKAIDDWNEGK